MTVQGRKILVVLAGNETIEFNYCVTRWAFGGVDGLGKIRGYSKKGMLDHWVTI